MFNIVNPKGKIMKLSEYIKTTRKDKHMTQEEMAKYVGVSKSYISMLESEKNYNRENKIVPSIKVLNNIARVAGMTLDDMFGQIDDIDVDISSTETPKTALPIRRKRIPLLGSVSCGVPKFAEQDYEGFVLADSDVNCDYAIRADGDSMIGARILDGDIVFIRQQEDVDDGEIAVVCIEDETLLKRVYHDDGELRLVAENPRVKTKIVKLDESETVRILGKAIAFQSDIR